MITIEGSEGVQGRVRDISRRTEDKYEYANEDEFLGSAILDGLHTINIGGYPVDILYRERHAETTIVMFHAAATTQASIPIFSGTRLTESVDANVIFFSDPSLNLDEEIKLGWFAGNQFQPLQAVIPRVIEHIHSSTHSKNLIFFGASGGGFAALYYSSLFPRSLAIGVNPRTIVNRSFPKAISRYGRLCWGATEDHEISDLFTNIIHSDLRVHTPRPATNTVAYIQNSQDNRYIQDSLLPYLQGSEDVSHVHLLMKDWGQGHVPADRKFLGELLTTAIARAPLWEDALEEFGFLPSPDASHVADIQKELQSRPTQREVVVTQRRGRLTQSLDSATPRLWPLSSVRPLSGNSSISSSVLENGLKIEWTHPGSRRLYLTTFAGGFSVPPTGTGSEVTSCVGESLVEVQFVTQDIEPQPVALTLFLVQYAGAERRRTDTWKFTVNSERQVHSAFVPILASADSYRLAFLVHSKVDGGFVLHDLHTKHYR